MLGFMGSRDFHSIPASHHTAQRHTREMPLCGVVFCLFDCLELSRKSHRNHTEIIPISFHGLQVGLGLLEVLWDELPVSAKDHLHIFMLQLLGTVPWGAPVVRSVDA